MRVPSCGFPQALQIGCDPNILDERCMFRPSVQHTYHWAGGALRVGHSASATQLLGMHFSVGRVQNRIITQSEVMLFTGNL